MTFLKLAPLLAIVLLAGCNGRTLSDVTPEQAGNALAIMSLWKPQGASTLPTGAYTLGPAPRMPMNCWQNGFFVTCQ